MSHPLKTTPISIASNLPEAAPSTRLDYLDAAKGIGIILVVFAHMIINGQDWVSDRIFNYIYVFHMPLFFLISGLTFNPDRHRSLIAFSQSRFKSLILPYLIFAFFSVALFLPQEQRVTSVMTDTLMARRQQMPFNEALWFLPALFLIEVGFFALCKAVRKPLIIIPVVIGLSYLGYPHTSKPMLFWSADAAAYYLIYYCIGFYIARANLHTKSIPTWLLCAIVAGTLVINIIGSYIADGIPSYYDVISMYYPRRFALIVVVALSGIALTLVLANILKTYKPLLLVGRESLLILGLHLPIRFLILEPLVIRSGLSIPVAENNLGLFYFTVVCIALVPAVFYFKKVMAYLR